jgi:hypothetical protein
VPTFFGDFLFPLAFLPGVGALEPAGVAFFLALTLPSVFAGVAAAAALAADFLPAEALPFFFSSDAAAATGAGAATAATGA